MTKADLVEELYMMATYTKKESDDIVDGVFELLKSTLESGENIKISGFGNFEMTEKSSRRGRNPQTGDPLEIAARKILTFKPGKVLKLAINQS